LIYRRDDPDSIAVKAVDIGFLDAERILALVHSPVPDNSMGFALELQSDLGAESWRHELPASPGRPSCSGT